MTYEYNYPSGPGRYNRRPSMLQVRVSLWLAYNRALISTTALGSSALGRTPGFKMPNRCRFLGAAANCQGHGDGFSFRYCGKKQENYLSRSAVIFLACHIAPIGSYWHTLWLFKHSHGKWPIEIDGFTVLKNGGSFNGKLLVITSWYIKMCHHSGILLDHVSAPLVTLGQGPLPSTGCP